MESGFVQMYRHLLFLARGYYMPEFFCRHLSEKLKIIFSPFSTHIKVTNIKKCGSQHHENYDI
jgi:hypothetical protein